MTKSVCITGILALLCLWTAAEAGEPSRFLAETPGKVLFIGNSYTYTPLGFGVFDQLPQIAAAAADPDTIVCESSPIGGGYVWDHWERGDAQAKIRANGYDAVVLQVYQPMLPFLQPDTLRDSVFKYVALYADLIDSVGSQLLFFMNWEKAWYPYDALAEVADSMGVQFDAPVVGCGAVWHMVLAERPQVNPYSSDKHHPSMGGTFLNSCVFYSAFTRKSPVGNPYLPDTSLSTEAAAYYRGAAWDYMRNYTEPACGDPDPPSVPAGVAGVPVSTSDNRITWDASDHAACGVRKYRVYRDGLFTGVSYRTEFLDGHLLGGYGYDYAVSAVSLGNVESALSAEVTVTTLLDTVPPSLAEVRDTRRPTSVTLTFSEPLDTATAETRDNYAVDNGVSVTAAALTAAHEVTLTVSALVTDIRYTVTVAGVRDNSTQRNPVTAGTAGTFMYVPLAFMENCIGYWPFDGTLDDFSVNGINGEWDSTASFGSGYLRQGIVGTGGTDGPFVHIPRNTVQGGMDELTLSLWFRKTHQDTGGYIVYRHGTYRIQVQADGLHARVETDSGTVSMTLEVPGIADTAWHHTALVYDGSTCELYVDGIRAGTQPHRGAVSTRFYELLVGKNPFSYQLTFKGGIDEFRMYDAAIDSAGIAALYSDAPYADGEADSAAVRMLLDRNAVARTVAAVTERDLASGRVTALYLDSLGIERLSSHVGQLQALRSLFCRGDAAGAGTSLVFIDPVVGTCTALETLVISGNALETLPDELTALTGLTLLDVAGNRLCTVSDAVRTWLDTYDPDWESTQEPCTVPVREPALPEPGLNGFSIGTNGGRVRFRYGGDDAAAAVTVRGMDGERMFARAGVGSDGVAWYGGTAGMYVVELTADGTTGRILLLVAGGSVIVRHR